MVCNRSAVILLEGKAVHTWQTLCQTELMIQHIMTLGRNALYMAMSYAFARLLLCNCSVQTDMFATVKRQLAETIQLRIPGTCFTF